jgi:hypothetical protein
MSDGNAPKPLNLLDEYPWRIILFRWFLAAAEIGIATFFVSRIRLELGVMFLAYGVVCAFVLLPAIRCVRCYYYGKRCNFGWGKWVSNIFSRSDNSPYASVYGFTILFWPLRMVPIALGLMSFSSVISGAFALDPNGLFLIYLFLIFLHRRFYRARACTRCHQRESCPVYDSQAMLLNTQRS